MAIVAKVTAKSGKTRKVTLRKGANLLPVADDAAITVVDEATGQVIADATVAREDGQVSVRVPDSYFAITDAGEASAAAIGDGGGAVERASAASGDSGANALGGGNVLPIAALGGLAVAGLAIAGGGGKGNGNGPPAPPTDTTPPAAPSGLALATADDTGTSNSDRITSQTTGLTITGTAEANSTVTLREGTTTLGTGKADANGNFSIDVSLAAGAHTIAATAVDAAGNASPASSNLAITVDTTAPAAPAALALATADDTGSSNSDRITSQGNALTITGTAEANSTVTLREGTTTLGTGTADANGNFSIDVSLAAGAHTIAATAVDAAGNASPASSNLAITVDTTAPAAPAALALATADDTGSSNSDRITSQGNALTITGTAEANSTVTLREGTTTLGTGTADANGNFSIDVSLAAGAHTIAATAVDAAGNASPASSGLAITVDATAPTLAISSSAATVFGSQTATLTFTFSEAPTGFTSSDVTVTGGTLSALTVSPTDPRVYTATLTPTATQSGNLTISVAAGSFADVAGNASTAAATLNVALDLGDSGEAIDGYIANALVFRDSDSDGQWDHETFTDSNNNGRFDSGEVFVDANQDGAFTAEFNTVTDAQGNFSGLFGTGNIVVAPLIAGDGANLSTDIATGNAFDSRLTAPDGSSVVTPLTSLIVAVAGANATPAQIEAAQLQVKAALGLDASVDLTTFDPIEVATTGDPAAVAAAIEIQKASVQIGNILSVIGSAAEAAGSTDGSAAGIDAAIKVIADQIAAGSSVDLADEALIGQIVQAAADASGSADAAQAISAQTEALSEALANVNTAVGQATGSTPLDTLAAITTVQIVAQEDLAAEIEAAIAGDTVLDSTSYEGAELAAKIDEAATEVEVIAPVEPVAGALGAPDRPTVDDGARVSAAEAADGIVVTVTYGADTGVAAGDSLRLAIGGTEVRSIVLTAADIPADGASGSLSITLTAADLGADGTKAITAGFVSAAGVAGAVSLPAVVNLDIVAPSAPSALQVSDGSLVTIAELADGVSVTGVAESNSTVSVEFTDGEQTLVRQAVATDGTFAVTLSAAEVAQFGEGTITFTATSTDAAGNVGPASPSGQFVYTAQPIVDSSARIDAAAPVVFETDDEARVVSVSRLAGGGFAVQWAGDTDGDRESDTIAVQQFAADGSKLGGVVTLTGLAPELIRAVEQNDDGAPFGFEVLTGGGYALTYALQPNEGFTQITVNRTVSQAPADQSFAIGGSPTEVFFFDEVPAGVTFALSGFQGTTQIVVPLTVIDGSIQITQAILDQFPDPSRLNLLVRNIPVSPTPFNFGVETELGRVVDLDSPVLTTSTTATVAGGFAVASTAGRAVSFDIEQVTPTATTNYQLRITPSAEDPVDLTGIPGATFANGTIIISNLQPNADGVIAVPQQILDQLGDSDARVVLIGFNLTDGTTFATTASYQPTEPVAEGVFVQTFGPDGVGTGQLSAPIDTAAPVLNEEDDGVVGISQLGNGGFAVNWIADLDQDGDGDTIAIQRFNADGTPDGAVDLLQGIAPELIASAEDDDDGPQAVIQALDGGGYALAYSLSPGEGFQSINVSRAAVQNPADQTFAIGGEPSEIYVGDAPAGVTFELRGSDGTTIINVPLNASDGTIRITPDILSQFANDNRLSLVVKNIQVGQSFGIWIETELDQVVDLDGPLQTVARSVSITNGFGAVGTPGRAESFDIEQVTPTASTAYQLQIIPATNSFIDLTGLAGAFQNNGVITIPNLVPDADGVIAVPQQILDQLGNDDASVLLIATGLTNGTTFEVTASYRATEDVPEGLFVQTFDADGVGTGMTGARIDAGQAILNDDDVVSGGINALADGGFAVHWIADADGDGDADGLFVQRFAADGSKQGDPIRLTGFSTELIGAFDDADPLPLDLQPLDNGGYAVSYAKGLDENGRQVTFVQGPAGTTPITPIVGLPSEIFVFSAPASAAFAVSGLGTDGVVKTIAVTPVDGVIQITQDMLDQFLSETRLSLSVSGLTQGQAVNLFIEVFESVTYDLSSTLVEVQSSRIVANGVGVIAAGDGRSEAFDIDSAATPTFVSMQITPIGGGAGFDLSGVPGASLLPTGTINIPNVAPDADGIYRVPQTILAQLGDQDATIILVVGGQTNGQTVTGTVFVREAIPEVEGVFVQTFDANGALVQSESELASAAGADGFSALAGNDHMAVPAGYDFLTGGDAHKPDGSTGAEEATEGISQDLFVLDGGLGQYLSLADLITDFAPRTDSLQSSEVLPFRDVLDVHGNEAINGDSSSGALVIHNVSGDMLTRLANSDAAMMTQASFA